MTTLSLFTATHDPRWMAELYASLRFQTWHEWVVLLNGEAKRDAFPDEMLADSRVRLIEAPSDLALSSDGKAKIGTLKSVACKACTGEALVEVDHDDLLMPRILEDVGAAFDDHPDISLVYSNCAEFNDSDGSPRTYGTTNGWEYLEFAHQGRRYLEILAPPPTAYHASLIWYAPNHIRAFRRSAYDAAGGYNESLSVLDDQDLMCRLFLVGPFYHIDRCGYLYRVHGENAWIKRNGEIQQNTRRIQRTYLYSMVEAEARRAGWKMIDLGGRFGCPKGYTAVDQTGPGVVADLNARYPFEDGEVGVVRAFDFLEHIADKMHSLREIHRVLRHGGYLLSQTPSTTGPNGEAGMGADQDPTHVSRWNRNAFWYVTRSQQAQYIDNTTVRFMPALLENCWPSQWHQDNCIPYVRADLIALKDGGTRPHGVLEI